MFQDVFQKVLSGVFQFFQTRNKRRVGLNYYTWSEQNGSSIIETFMAEPLHVCMQLSKHHAPMDACSNSHVLCLQVGPSRRKHAAEGALRSWRWPSRWCSCASRSGACWGKARHSWEGMKGHSHGICPGKGTRLFCFTF